MIGSFWFALAMIFATAASLCTCWIAIEDRKITLSLVSLAVAVIAGSLLVANIVATYHAKAADSGRSRVECLASGNWWIPMNDGVCAEHLPTTTTEGTR